MSAEISKEKQQELQQKYMEMQMISQQMQQTQKQIQVLGQQLEELNLTKEALDDISKTEPETEIRVPLASGIFVKGKITDNKQVYVNVGAGTSVAKTVDEAKALIDTQIKELSDFKTQTESSLQQISAKVQANEKELSELYK